MKRIFISTTLVCAAVFSGFGQNAASQISENVISDDQPSVVYFIEEISPESLIRIYEALGRDATGNVAVKISTGEPGGHN